LSTRSSSQKEEKVWEGILKSRQSRMDAKHLETILANVPSLASSKLNGRQICNVLNVAEGLAFNDYNQPGQMQYSHILKAVKAALEFQSSSMRPGCKTGTDRPFGLLLDGK